MPRRKKSSVDESDFEALDRLAKSLTFENTRPLNKRERARWDATVKRGRPRKSPDAKAVPTLITVEPKLLKKADAFAKKTGISRSQLFSDAIRQRLGLAS